jgi:hypothetical protein
VSIIKEVEKFKVQSLNYDKKIKLASVSYLRQGEKGDLARPRGNAKTIYILIEKGHRELNIAFLNVIKIIIIKKLFSHFKNSKKNYYLYLLVRAQIVGSSVDHKNLRNGPD